MVARQPHLAILNAIQCELNLPAAFRARVTIFKQQIDEAISSIFNKKLNSQKN